MPGRRRPVRRAAAPRRSRSSRPSGAPGSPCATASSRRRRPARPARAACRWRSPSRSRATRASSRFSHSRCAAPRMPRCGSAYALPSFGSLYVRMSSTNTSSSGPCETLAVDPAARPAARRSAGTRGTPAAPARRARRRASRCSGRRRGSRPGTSCCATSWSSHWLICGTCGGERAQVLVEQVVARTGRGTRRASRRPWTSPAVDDVAPGAPVGQRHGLGERAVGVDGVAAAQEEVGLERRASPRRSGSRRGRG